MLLDIRKQKNGTIVLTSPDGTVYPFKFDAEKESAFFEEIGRTMIDILADPDMPKETMESGRVTQGRPVPDGEGGAVGHFRGCLDSIVPGVQLSKGLDFLQDMSIDEDPDKPDEATG